jgi:hypothetical protein
MKFRTLIPLILLLSLLGCQQTPPSPALGEGTGERETPTAENTPPPTLTPTLIPTPTEVPLEALPVDEIVQKYLAGEIDHVSSLNFEQRKAFSIALDKERDTQRGPSPIIFTDRNGDKFYVDPVTLDFKPVGDGTTAEQQTIDNTLPRVVDDEGYTHVYHNGEWIKIEESNNIQFYNFDNFPWPAGKAVDPQYVPEEHRHLLGLTVPEYAYKSEGEKINMVPVFFLGKEHGETSIPGHSLNGTLLTYVINEKDSYSVTTTMITGVPVLYANNLRAAVPGDITENSDFYQAIMSGDLYYMMYKVNQVEAFNTMYQALNGQEATKNYKGLASTKDAHKIITGETKSNNIPLINIRSLVKAGKQTDN